MIGRYCTAESVAALKRWFAVAAVVVAVAEAQLGRELGVLEAHLGSSVAEPYLVVDQAGR